MSRCAVSLAIIVAAAAHAQPLTTAFTFQGSLDSAGAPVSGTYDLRFTLYDAAAGGTPQGPQLCSDNVTVTNGTFAVQLDFGGQFSGSQRFLEVQVRQDTGLACSNATGFTTLSPRQSLTGSPNSVFSLAAANTTQLNSQPASFYQNASNLSSGTLPGARLGGSYASVVSLTNAGNSFSGSGAGLTSLNASGVATGTLADARLSANVPLLNASNTFVGTANTFQGNLGIGALTPGFKLSVTGGMSLFDGAGQGIHLTSNTIAFSNALNEDPAYAYAASPEQHDFYIGGASVMTIAASGKVGIGTPTPSSRLSVIDSATTAILAQGGQRGVQGNATGVSGGTFGVFGVSPSDSGAGVFGASTHGTGLASGVSGTSSSTAGRGVYGEATATSGTTYGVYGASASTAGSGVYGEATSGSGFTAGVRGVCTSPFGAGIAGDGAATGGLFQTSSANGRAAYGHALASSGSSTGVWGQTEAPEGAGVYGLANASAGLSTGVYGESHSTSGDGVQGFASASTGSTSGGAFLCSSPSGAGVVGFGFAMSGTNVGVRGSTQSPNGRGVYGYSLVGTASATPYGVLGEVDNATNGFAVFALGDLGASGVKSFRIDHPQDPANKYLLHYAAESPEVLNIYCGKIVLDEQGAATVLLPAYFAAINKDPRYTLTPIGASMPLLHVAEEISESALADGEKAAPGDPVPPCSFRIAGGAPNAKVSWEVKAVRNDLRIRLHGAPVEREKTGPEGGRYQHPDYYGLPPDMGMDEPPSPPPAPPTRPTGTPHAPPDAPLPHAP